MFAFEQVTTNIFVIDILCHGGTKELKNNLRELSCSYSDTFISVPVYKVKVKIICFWFLEIVDGGWGSIKKCLDLNWTHGLKGEDFNSNFVKIVLSVIF